jgi:hypothetical protein
MAQHIGIRPPDSDGQSGVLGWTHTFTPTLTNEFRLGYERNLSYAQQDPFGLNHADQFVPGVPENPAVDGGVSQTTFTTP